jgi:GNAT superfamily N-acetyltransferase
MKKITPKIFDKITDIVSPGYIFHYSKSFWGESIYIIEEHGFAMIRMYWYKNNNSIAIDNLSVEKDSRKIGIGTGLLEMSEEIGRYLGAKKACLWVKENTRQHKWYQRKGYEFSSDYEGEKGYIWMRKGIGS